MIASEKYIYIVMFCSYLSFRYKIYFFLTETGENLISAQPQISAHLEKAPTLKVQKLIKCPGRLID